MAKLKVGDLSKQLSISTKSLISLLKELDYPVSDAESMVDERVAKAVTEAVSQAFSQERPRKAQPPQPSAQDTTEAARPIQREPITPAATPSPSRQPDEVKAKEEVSSRAPEAAPRHPSAETQAPRTANDSEGVKPSQQVQRDERPFQSVQNNQGGPRPDFRRPDQRDNRPPRQDGRFNPPTDRRDGQTVDNDGQARPIPQGGQPGQQDNRYPQRPAPYQGQRPYPQPSGPRPEGGQGGAPFRPYGQRPEGQARPPMGQQGGYQQGGPRPDGQQGAPRPYGQQGGPRPYGQQGGYQQGGPRPDGQQGGPRPYGQQGGYQQGGPRPDGQQGGPRPYGQQGGPRPYGQQGGYQQGGPRPDGQQGGPRPYGQQGGPRPYGQQGGGPRPGGQQGGRPGFGQGGGRPGGGYGQGGGRPDGNRPRPAGGGRPGFAVPAPAATPAQAPTKVVKKDRKYSDERYRDQERQYSTEGEGSARPRRGSNNRSHRQIAAPERSNTQTPSQVELGGAITVKGLSDLLKTDVASVIKKLMTLGVLATMNQEIDLDTATLVVNEFGSTVIAPKEAPNPEAIIEQDVDDPANLEERPPVVTVMGHVDHGKTSLLDAIRHANVAAGEAGGITQHIGAYTVELNGRKITFLDTPGHEAFTAMRARGAQVTDIAVLVVAADDGVMPQTIEAINHAKAAKVPIVVAINKIDRPNANPDRVKQELTEYELVAEEWGGETIMAPVSAIKREGIDTLLESILLVADVAELKANPNRKAVGSVVEAKLDKGRGPVATVLVHNGTLSIGDVVIVGDTFGKVRAMVDDKGRRIKKAPPSTPVEVIGLTGVPAAGDRLYAVDDEKQARVLAESRNSQKRLEEQQKGHRVTLEELFSQMQEGEVKDLNLIIKADVQGSVEAVKQAMERLSNKEVRVNILHSGVGAVSENDVMLASTSSAIVIGFNVRPDQNAQKVAEVQHVDIRTYRIIYEAIQEVEAAMKGLLAPVFKEAIQGHAEVRELFKVSKLGTIAGCYVNDGKVLRSSTIRVIRDGKVVHEGKIDSLKRVKDDVREVTAGYECGILLERFNDVKEGDSLEAYTMEEVQRS